MMVLTPSNASGFWLPSEFVVLLNRSQSTSEGLDRWINGVFIELRSATNCERSLLINCTSSPPLELTRFIRKSSPFEWGWIWIWSPSAKLTLRNTGTSWIELNLPSFLKISITPSVPDRRRKMVGKRLAASDMSREPVEGDQRQSPVLHGDFTLIIAEPVGLRVNGHIARVILVVPVHIDIDRGVLDRPVMNRA